MSADSPEPTPYYRYQDGDSEIPRPPAPEGYASRMIYCADCVQWVIKDRWYSHLSIVKH